MYIAFNSIQVVLELNSDLGACYFISRYIDSYVAAFIFFNREHCQLSMKITLI
jgi:hypothetical protein